RKAEMLKKFDKDGDGELNDDEKKAMREAGKAAIIKKYDTDGDGVLSDEEKKAMPKRRRGGPEGRKPGGPKGGPKGGAKKDKPAAE
ncbi:hypothetical protein N9978_02860, partial [Akkermansiaceae bacterium]|nr:hypothetical protein [Akkermansiaceae bacterium]